MVEALVGLELVDEVVQSFVEFLSHLVVLLKDIEDVGCLPRDLAKRLRHKIAPRRAPRTGVLAGFPLNFPVYKDSFPRLLPSFPQDFRLGSFLLQDFGRLAGSISP